MTYQWKTPLDWLKEAIQDYTREQLQEAFMLVVSELDFETLQWCFEAEMDKDGYFDPIEESEA